MGETAMATVQKREDFRGRTLVKDHQGRLGVVVSLSSEFDSAVVLVEFDGCSETEEVSWEELTITGRLKIEFGIECAKCVFRPGGKVCHRYWHPSNGFIPVDGQRKPTRIYPYCQRS